MKRTNFTLLLATAVLTSTLSSGANASMTTYSSLRCEYISRLVQFDTVRTIRLTNIGNGTVPARAGYKIVHPARTFNLKLNRSLAPKQQAASPIAYDLGSSSRCRASAHWYIPDDVRR